MQSQSIEAHELHCSRAATLDGEMKEVKNVVDQLRATWNVTKVIVPLSALVVLAHTVWQFWLGIHGGR